MKKEVIRFCKMCLGLLPNYKNNNTIYCCDVSYNLYKAEVAKKHNLESVMKIIISILNENENKKKHNAC